MRRRYPAPLPLLPRSRSLATGMLQLFSDAAKYGGPRVAQHDMHVIFAAIAHFCQPDTRGSAVASAAPAPSRGGEEEDRRPSAASLAATVAERAAAFEERRAAAKFSVKELGAVEAFLENPQEVTLVRTVLRQLQRDMKALRTRAAARRTRVP